MKHRLVLFSLLAAPLSMPSAVGQSQDSPLEIPARIATARCVYAPAEEDCSALPDRGHERQSLKDDTIAQIPRRIPSRPSGRPMGYPPAAYSSRWMGGPSGGHVLIGAGIGFGLGATLGAIGGAHSGTSGQSAILGGSLFALIGAAIGASHVGPPPFMHRRRFYRGSWPEDDEEGTRRSHSKRTEHHAELSVPEQPVVAKPPDVGANAAPPPRMTAIP